MSRSKTKANQRAVNLYLTNDAIEQGNAIAKAEGRSLSQQVVKLLERESKRLKLKPKAA